MYYPWDICSIVQKVGDRGFDTEKVFSSIKPKYLCLTIRDDKWHPFHFRYYFMNETIFWSEKIITMKKEIFDL